ncbi:hypothetical protein MUY14_14370 [Amycolatopsis sp. FBCC-B4732]|uniref:hypothetical protein n=1 Tax=Amycolatopsis sp. FBCC-B4732 TaxID=3079339 RepID=UPI001FF4A560|nr:hypothetical protein [Amycolatopsis sp. FBCC-B4732]UOX91751.1 hypothetical protein MUY14_14370 [Amycolatopsis sp. FBCC-B4732]
MRNRVTPAGDVVDVPLRGAWTGNRGVLHDGHEIVRFHAGDLWITCALEFRGRWREQWLPNRYTHLFFHDEAVSFAAGHRPCAECRRRAYTAYRAAWPGPATPSAAGMNRRLHAERLVRGTHLRRRHELPWAGLPDGVFVLRGRRPELVVGGQLTEWTTAGYGTRRKLPRAGTVPVLTPPATVAVLRAGYPVQIDDSAR